jgi:hypothetical protein
MNNTKYYHVYPIINFYSNAGTIIKTKVRLVPGCSTLDYPQYFSIALIFSKMEKLEPDNWMNDIGEKILIVRISSGYIMLLQVIQL